MEMDDRRRPCFFKVFLPDLSSEFMTIPPAFWQHMESESPRGVVSLKGPSGRVWCVDLVKDSRGLCFDTGWNEFLADHSIKFGDFLIFRYDSSFHFTVSIFDDTSCEKKSAFSAKPQHEDMILKENNASLEENIASVVPPTGAMEASQNDLISVAVKTEMESDNDCMVIKCDNATSTINEIGSKQHFQDAHNSQKTVVAPKIPSGQASWRRRRGMGDKLAVHGTLDKKTDYSTKPNSMIKQVSKIDPRGINLMLRSIAKKPKEFTSIQIRKLQAIVEEFQQWSLFSQRQTLPKPQQEFVILDENEFSVVPPNGTMEASESWRKKRKRKRGRKNDKISVFIKSEIESDHDCMVFRRGHATSAINEYGLRPHFWHARNSRKAGVVPKLQSEATLSPSGRGRPPLRRRRGICDKLIVQGTLNEKTGYSAISNSLIKQVSIIDPRGVNLMLRTIAKNPRKFISIQIRPNQIRRLQVMVKEFQKWSLLSQRPAVPMRPVSKQHLCKALEMANSFESENPFIIIVMREAYVSKSYCLHFPRLFTKEYLSMDDQKMIIWDPNGLPWPVKFNCYNNCGRFLSGWPKFCQAHKLKVQDVCVFEVIEKNQMKVHIFRVVDEQL